MYTIIKISSLSESHLQLIIFHMHYIVVIPKFNFQIIYSFRAFYYLLRQSANDRILLLSIDQLSLVSLK